ncbi:MAG: nicotinate phosphoribosyltransferase [Smithella sp.]
MINPLTSPLLTDLYQLTMMETYLQNGMDKTAVFEFYVRKLPENRGFLIATGLNSVLSFLENLQFSSTEIDYLAKTGRFSQKLLDYLSSCRFCGDVYALPEGTVCFANEPLIRVVAPLPMAQLVETRLMNFLHFETIIASKAARCVLAAGGKGLVDFGLRRTHGAEAGTLAARSTYISGFAGTATVIAEKLYGIPIFGTMAHSYIEAFGNEEEAFVAFGRANPNNVTFLIDTYDTLRGAKAAVNAAKRLSKEGIKTQAVRLDSGDFLALSKEVRSILDQNGVPEIRILASGNVDELMIRKLAADGAPIDAFGVGTKLDTSEDAPYMECAYKLMEYDGKPRLKKSSGKATLPGRKQVMRCCRDGVMVRDIVAKEGDVQEGTPLIKKVMDQGRRISPQPDLAEIAAYTKSQLQSLPEHLRELAVAPSYPVEIAPSLLRLRETAEQLIG